MTRYAVSTAVVTALSLLAGCGDDGGDGSESGISAASTISTSTAESTNGDDGSAAHTPTTERPAPSVEEGRGSWDLVALGDSTPDGTGVRSNEVYTRRYADLLSDELDVVVEVHDYSSGDLPGRIADWTETVTTDEALRADLIEAEIVTLFLGFHDILLITVLGPDRCSGEWPDPLETCLREGAASIPADFEQLLAEIDSLVPEDATVLVGYDGGLPIAMPPFEQWSHEPYWPQIRRILIDDWRPGLYAAADAHGAIVIPFYEAVEGPNGLVLHPEFLQSDGLHFSAEGHRFLAELHLANDGLRVD